MSKVTTDHVILENEFLECWPIIRAARSDLKILSENIPAMPCLKESALKRLLELVALRSPSDALYTALEEALSVATKNGGIALQMWWSDVAWLKRRLVACCKKPPQPIHLARNPITILELQKIELTKAEKLTTENTEITEEDESNVSIRDHPRK